MKQKPDFFAKLDGSGRTPRDAQASILRELQDKWEDWQVFAITAPTGLGKTYLSRAIQLATNAAYITSSNVLVRQYADTYGSPYFIGADHYSSAAAYDNAKFQSLFPDNMTCYNPCSWRIAKRQKQFQMPEVIICDEADQFLGLLRELATTTLLVSGPDSRKRNLQVPENAAQYLLQCAAEKRAKSTEHEQNGKKMQARRAAESAVKLEEIAESLLVEPERFAIELEEKWGKRGKLRYIHICPTFLPKETAKIFFRDTKIILLSATLLPSDVYEITGGTPFHGIAAPSPIPPERRRIYFKPCEESLSYPVNYPALAGRLDEILAELPELRPAIIHTTYQDAQQLHRLMKTPTVTYDKEDKQEMLAKFMSEGGVILAAGATTGLDLKGALCRLNIISKLLFANLGSDVVQKKLALPGGKRAYALSAMRDLVQAAGRSTRSESDYSVTFVLDNRFAKLYKDNREDVPDFVKDSIVWQSVPYASIRTESEKYLGTSGKDT